MPLVLSFNNLKDVMKDSDEHVVIETGPAEPDHAAPPNWIVFNKDVINTFQIRHIKKLDKCIRFYYDHGYYEDVDCRVDIAWPVVQELFKRGE